MRLSLRTWTLFAITPLPFLVFVADVVEEPVRTSPAILCLISCFVVFGAALATAVEPRDDSGTALCLTAMGVFCMAARAVIMQSMPLLLSTLGISGLLFLAVVYASPHVKVKEK